MTGGDSLNLLQSDNATYNYYRYANEIDQYAQKHYQSMMTWILSQKWHFTQTIAVVTGKGYFEQYRPFMSFESLGLPDIPLGLVVLTGTEGFAAAGWIMAAPLHQRLFSTAAAT